MPTKADFNFFFPFRVRYSEIDGQKVVFNAHYLTYYDTALAEYFRDLGWDYEAHVQETGDDFHTVKTVVEYKAPIMFDAEIEVHVRAARIGNSSISFETAIFDKHDETLYATGEVVWVNTNQAAHKPVPVPDDLIAKLVARDGEDIVARTGRAA